MTRKPARHIKRTGLYCQLFADVLGWPQEQVENIRLAAPMHDLGKIGIPDAILQKPGKLTREEFEVMKTHTAIWRGCWRGRARRYCRWRTRLRWPTTRGGTAAATRGALRNWRSPNRPASWQSSTFYHVLTHRRVYHEAVSEAEALEIMEPGRGKQFDAFLFGIFLSILPEIRRIAAENPDEQRGGLRPRGGGATRSASAVRR